MKPGVTPPLNASLFHRENDPIGVVCVAPSQLPTSRRSRILYHNTTDWPVTLEFPDDLCATVDPNPVPPVGAAPNNTTTVDIGNPNCGTYAYKVVASLEACPLCATTFSAPMTLDVQTLSADRGDGDSDPVIIIEQ